LNGDLCSEKHALLAIGMGSGKSGTGACFGGFGGGHLFFRYARNSPCRPTNQLPMQRPVEYIRVFADADGESHLETATITVQPEQFAPPAPPLDVSAMNRTTGWSLLRFAADWVGGWHCTPSRQWMFVMAGETTVRTSDGSQCDLRAGSICLLEDTRGKGHLTTIIGGHEVLMVAVHIPDDEPAA